MPVNVLPFAPDVEPISVPLVDDPQLGDRMETAASVCRVLHVINGEHYSGAERVQDLLACQLPRLGWEVGFACVKPGRFPTVRDSQDVPLVELPMRGRFDLRVVKRLIGMVRQERYQLIHAHTPRTALIGSIAARWVGVPFVYHVHSPVGRDSTRPIANWTNAMVERYALRNANRVIAVSPSLRQYMVNRGVPAERVVYVPNGVPGSNQAVERRRPIAAWTLGAVALFRPRKGIEVLLESLAALRSRGLNVRLRAVGGFESTSYESAVHALALRLGLAEAIDWIGFTRDTQRELAKIDLLVLPSLFGEGLPMVVLEAMAAAVPVVASRVEGVPEAVVHRQTGLLVEAGSVSQLAHAIEEIVCDRVDYAALSRAALERHATLFSDTTMAKGVAAVYRDVLVDGKSSKV